MLAAVMDAIEDDDIELVKTLVGCRVMGMVVAHKFKAGWKSKLECHYFFATSADGGDQFGQCG